jgi:molybdopterin converting factor small subunit
VPTVTLDVQPPLDQPLREADGDGGLVWEEEVALGATLGRLFTRLINERPGFRTIYDPATGRLAERVGLTINRRNYQLLGGLTYLLRDGDRLTLVLGEVGLGSHD